MKISWLGKILVRIGVLHLCNGEIKKHEWGNWVPAGNELHGNEREPIQKRVCKNCKHRETRKTKEKN